MDHIVTSLSWFLVVWQAALYFVAAPLLVGWIRKVKAILQNRRGPPLLQPYRNLYKLMAKEVRVAHTASPLFRAAPYIVFISTWLAAASVPLMTATTPVTAMADVIVLVGMLALGRFFLALAGMDVGTSFGGMGSSREMLISSLAEPAMLMAVFTLAMTAHSTNLATIVEYQITSELVLRPSFLFAFFGLLLVAIAETGRIPVDNPATHLELTMIHEAMILEYSGRHLAFMEWASQLKLMIYGVLLSNIFFPWGIAHSFATADLLLGMVAITLKLGLLGIILATGETVLAKMRLFRAPEFLNLAFLLALLGLLSHVILEVGS